MLIKRSSDKPKLQYYTKIPRDFKILSINCQLQDIYRIQFESKFFPELQEDTVNV